MAGGGRRVDGDADRDHDPLGPPLELAALPAQRLAELGVSGELDEEVGALAVGDQAAHVESSAGVAPSLE
jgi:hypothetical protein